MGEKREKKRSVNEPDDSEGIKESVGGGGEVERERVDDTHHFNYYEDYQLEERNTCERCK